MCLERGYASVTRPLLQRSPHRTVQRKYPPPPRPSSARVLPHFRVLIRVPPVQLALLVTGVT